MNLRMDHYHFEYMAHFAIIFPVLTIKWWKQLSVYFKWCKLPEDGAINRRICQYGYDNVFAPIRIQTNHLWFYRWNDLKNQENPILFEKTNEQLKIIIINIKRFQQDVWKPFKTITYWIRHYISKLRAFTKTWILAAWNLSNLGVWWKKEPV
jgi:hypothetical protein